MRIDNPRVLRKSQLFDIDTLYIREARSWTIAEMSDERPKVLDGECRLCWLLLAYDFRIVTSGYIWQG